TRPHEALVTVLRHVQRVARYRCEVIALKTEVKRAADRICERPHDRFERHADVGTETNACRAEAGPEQVEMHAADRRIGAEANTGAAAAVVDLAKVTVQR